MSKAVITWGRLNPVTIGHEKLVNKVKSEAKKRGAMPHVFISHSQDAKKNPLDYNTKYNFARKAFGPVVTKSTSKTIIQVLQEVEKMGHNEVVIIVGSDRVSEFKTFTSKYNGKDYTFDKLEVVSAGERDPDAEGVSGMSASKMRAVAQAGDYDSFKTGTPSKMSEKDKKAMYDKIRSVMGVNEEIEVDDSDFDISDQELDAFVEMIDLDKLDEEGELDEEFEMFLEEMELAERKPLTVPQRLAIGRRMKRLAPRMQRKRAIQMKRMADPKRLEKRARKAAVKLLRKRFAGKQGANYASLSPGAKISVDRIIQKKMAMVGKISKRMMPKIRKAEIERLKAARGSKNEAMNLDSQFELILKESVSVQIILKEEDEETNQKLLYMLRQAFTNATERQLVIRALQGGEKSLQNPKLRPFILKLLNRLLDATQSDPSMFVKMKDRLRRMAQADSKETNESVKIVESFKVKSAKSGIPLDIIFECFMREEDSDKGFNRVNSFIAGGKAWEIDSDLAEKVVKSTGGLKDACWKGYTAVGTKKKNGKTVPNCVPEEAELDEITIAQLKGKVSKKIMTRSKRDGLIQKVKEKGLATVANMYGISARELQSITEAKSPLQRLKDFDKTRVAVGKRPIFDPKSTEFRNVSKKQKRLDQTSNEDVDATKEKIAREKEADKVKHDSMMDRARIQDTQAKNRVSLKKESVDEAFESFLVEKVNQTQIDQLEKFADRILQKYDIDITFTKHFVDRLNDTRNNPEIKVAELQKFFKKIERKKGEGIKQNADTEVVLKDLTTNLNLPVVINYKNGEFEVVNKTIMRKKDFKSPDKTIQYEEVLEEGINDPAIFKAVFLAGGPGSGKSFVVKKTGLASMGFVVINSDDAFERALKKAGLSTTPEDIFSVQGQEIRGGAKTLTAKRQETVLKGRLGVVVDGTGRDYDKIQKQAQILKDIGYDVGMIFVNTDMKTALERNRQRERILPDDTVEKMWKDVQKNMGKFQRFFGQNFQIVDNSIDSNFKSEIQSAYKMMGKFAKKPIINPKSKKWIEQEKKKRGINEAFESFLEDEHKDCGTPECCGQCPTANTVSESLTEAGGAGEEGTTKLKKKYQDDTPGQTCEEEDWGCWCSEENLLESELQEAEYQGKKVTLNDPVRSSDGKKKFHVYVKNEKGNIIKLGFGDPNMEIKRDDPARRKSFRARHNCSDPGPKWKARYWSCYQWRGSAKVDN
jgi:predicted kinase